MIKMNIYLDNRNKIYRNNNMIVINTNYSGWQLENRNIGFNDIYGIKYFTEDIELNSYYYGLHLLYPYWLTNGDLNDIDIRYATTNLYISSY